MPRWDVTCPECRHTFTHTEIEPSIIEQSRRDPFKILTEPKIPQTGGTRTCPNCKKESFYQAFQLFYRENGLGQTP